MQEPRVILVIFGELVKNPKGFVLGKVQPDGLKPLVSPPS